MTTQRNFEGTPPPRSKMNAQPALPTTARSEGNWVGGSTGKSKPRYTNKPQINFQGSIDIPTRFEKGQGQAPGTG